MLWNRARLDEFDDWGRACRKCDFVLSGDFKVLKVTLSLPNARCLITFYYLNVYSKRWQSMRTNQIGEDNSPSLSKS